MRRWMLTTLLVFGAVSGDLFAQQTAPPDTTKTAASTTAQSDSAKIDTRAKEQAAHRRKLLWWTGGIALFIGLNLLISDRPPGK